MRRLAVVFVWITCTVGAMARPERNAYLNKPVRSVYQLIRQVRNDPQVADRYMRHFSVTKEQVIALFKGLHTSRLKRSQTFRMYSVPEGGALRVHVCRLRSGAGVFADAHGTPVLRLICGNPISEGSKADKEPHAGETSPPEVLHEAPFKPLAWSKGGIRNPSADLVLREPTPHISILPPTQEQAFPKKEPPLSVVEHPAPTPSMEPTPLSRPEALSGVDLGEVLPLLGATLPILIVTGGHRHHSFSPPPPSPVPEPVSAIGMSAALYALARKRRASRR